MEVSKAYYVQYLDMDGFEVQASAGQVDSDHWSTDL